MQLETNLMTELSNQRQILPDSVVPIFDQLIAFQAQVILLLQQVCQTSDRQRFSNFNQNIIIDDVAWQTHIGHYAKVINEGDPAQLFIPLWAATAALEKTAIYYRQCMAAAVYPSEKLFASSLAEIKKITARRMESAIRICINHTWEKLGFCPFPLN